MNITDFSLKLSGFPIKKAKALVNEIQSLSADEYNDFIEKQKKELVNFHLSNNSFYKNLLTNKSTKWEKLPIITKFDLQTPLQARLSKGYTEKNVHIHKTSGSSGHPFIFAKNKYAHAITWAIFYNWYNWYDVHSKKQARFYGIPSSGKTRLKELLKDSFSNRHRFNVFDLTNEAMGVWLKKFNSKNFVFMTGYTSVIVAFAHFLKFKNIILKEICPTLKVCFPTSEMCSDEEKQFISKVFGIPVAREYGAAEFGLIALEHDGSWILNNTNLFVEIVDENGNSLPYGSEGRIIITDLFNKAHPFIRYDIGDIGKINKINGQMVLESLIGRKEDYVLLPSGKKAPGLALYYVTKSVMDNTGFINEIKVVQTKIDTLEIHYVSKKELEKSQKKEIVLAVTTYLESNMKLIFIHKTHLDRTLRGKLKQFTSLLKKT